MAEAALNLWFAVGAVGFLALFCWAARLSPWWYPLIMFASAVPGIVQHRPERIWSLLLITLGGTYIVWPERGIAWMARQRNSSRYALIVRFFDSVHGMLLYRIIGVFVIGMGISWWYAQPGSFNGRLTPPRAESFPAAYRRAYADSMHRAAVVSVPKPTADYKGDVPKFVKAEMALAAAYHKSADEFRSLDTPEEYRILQSATVDYFECDAQKLDFYSAEEPHPGHDFKSKVASWREKTKSASDRLRDALGDKADDAQQFAEILKMHDWEDK